MTPSTSVDVSVIIVNWNTVNLLRDCLASVFSETTGLTFEVIVVDNASTDGSPEMVKKEFGETILIRNDTNLGFATANNQAIIIARGRYVLLLNSDTVILDGAIQKTIVFADRYPDASVVGCRILNSDRSLQNSCFMFPSLINLLLSSIYLDRLFSRSRFFGREQMTWWDRDNEQEVDVVTGCYMLVRREAIDDVGMLDSGFFMYAEETDWCYRFRCSGWKNRFTPDARIIHIGGGSAAKFSARRAQITNASYIRYMKRHWSRPKALAGVGLIALFYALRLLVLIPKCSFSLTFREDDEKRLENHWAGLKDILARVAVVR